MRTKPKYRHIKLPLRTIVREPHHVLIIEDAVQRVNRLVVKAYQLVRLWSLQMIENGSWRRMIDEGKNPIEEKHFRTAFRVIRSDSRIPPRPPRGEENPEAESRLKLLREFQDLFEEVFTQEDREDGSNLTQVLKYCETEMYTCLLYTSPSPRDS